MRRWIRAAWATTSLCAGTSAAPAANDSALLKAALVMRTFDHYAAACQRLGGFQGGDASAVKAWEAEHRVDRIRARFAELDADPARRQQLERGVADVVRQIDAKGVGPCRAALTASRTRDAQFANVAPQLVAAEPDGKPTAQPKAAVEPAAAKRDAAVLAQIEAFGFDTRAAMGIGGFITTDIYPVVLFRDGRLLTDVEGLVFPGGAAAHRQAHAKAWTRWRRDGGELQVDGAKGWRKLAFQVIYPKLPDGFRLDGMYRRLGGTGNVAVGGGDAVAAWNEYRFRRDGRVVRGGGAGGRAETGGGSVVTSSQRAGRHGSYRVDGLMLKIRYDDGGEESRLLITDPKDPTGAIWLDGRGYAQRKG